MRGRADPADAGGRPIARFEDFRQSRAIADPGQDAMRTTTTTALLVLAIALGGCAMDSGRGKRGAFDDAEIRAAERALEQALQSADRTAWVYSYTEDAVFVPPGGAAVQGRAALLQMATAMQPLADVRIQPVRTDGSERVAAVYALASWSSGQPPAAGSVTKMRAIIVWRKEADGQWRVAQELLHADPSAGR